MSYVAYVTRNQSASIRNNIFFQDLVTFNQNIFNPF